MFYFTPHIKMNKIYVSLIIVKLSTFLLNIKFYWVQEMPFQQLACDIINGRGLWKVIA